MIPSHYRKILSHLRHLISHKRAKFVGVCITALTSVAVMAGGLIGFAADLRELGVPVPPLFDVDEPLSEEEIGSPTPKNEEASEARISCSLLFDNGKFVPSTVAINIANFQYKAVNAIVRDIPEEVLSGNDVEVQVRCDQVWKNSSLLMNDGKCSILYPC